MRSPSPAEVPCSRTTLPLTETRPAAISSSARRRDATPAWARYLCSLTAALLRHRVAVTGGAGDCRAVSSRSGRLCGRCRWFMGGSLLMRDRVLMLAAAVMVCGASLCAPAGATTTRLLPPAQTGPRIGDGALQLPAVHGSATFSDPVVAGPPVRAPHTASCKVTLIDQYQFTNFTPATGSVRRAGFVSGTVVQGDPRLECQRFGSAVRPARSDLARRHRDLHFTTSEPPGPQVSWHVDKDVTEYANTLVDGDRLHRFARQRRQQHIYRNLRRDRHA